MSEPELQQLHVDLIMPSPFNPRRDFSKESLAELAESIRASGVQSPLLVRPLNGKFQIVAGERRYRAAKMAGLKAVPCVVSEMDEREAREAQIVENLQREGIAPLEEAQGFQDLLKAIGSAGATTSPTVNDLAARVGKSPRYVYARLELLKLADPVKKALDASKIEAGHAQELVPLKPEQQEEMLQAINLRADHSPMSVKALREYIKYRYAPKLAPPKISAKERERRRKEAARQKKADDAWKQERARSEAEKKLREAVNRRAIAALWPKLHAAKGKDAAGFLDTLLQQFTEESESLSEAWLVSEGKPIPREFRRVPDIARKFEKRPLADRVALAMLALVINDLEWGPAPIAAPVLRWAKIDRKAIARELALDERSAAKVAAAKARAAAADASRAIHQLHPKVQTSAKSKTKRAAKKKAGK